MTKDIQGAAEGNVVVTWDQDRTRILAVTRQDDDGHILSVIAEVPAPNVQPKGTAEGEVERLRAALAAQPQARVALTNEQIAKASRDAHIAFALGKHQTYEHALTRAVEAALGIPAPQTKEPTNDR